MIGDNQIIQHIKQFMFIKKWESYDKADHFDQMIFNKI